jgi:hypothetical protein
MQRLILFQKANLLLVYLRKAFPLHGHVQVAVIWKWYVNFFARFNVSYANTVVNLNINDLDKQYENKVIVL